MNQTMLELVIGLHWGAVVIYVIASVMVIAGLFFQKERLTANAYRLAIPGLIIHGAAILIWWRMVGHGPYLDRFEVLSSDAWTLMAGFLIILRFYPRLGSISVVVFPATFSMVAMGLFLRPEIKMLPPTFRSIWLVLHILFYKIAFASIIAAFAFSLFYLLRGRGRLTGWTRLPDLPTMDLLAYRFAGFGFTFWAIGMLAGSIWSYQSWNQFWSWDPVQTWSLVTWGCFGVYLHLRRFYRWEGERAAWFYGVCFTLTLISLFFTPFIKSSIHAEYFK
jgi:ABC-type transport system involved in cytochrome c biogenesis permease subunit